MGERAYSICVFCGSSPLAPPPFVAAAASLGERIAAAGARLVYGGGGVGLMGACAAAARSAGGEVLGVIPAFLTHVEAAPAGAEIVVVESMHARKAMMFEQSDVFVVLPGAIGTLEEVVELLSWRGLGLHAKPIVFFNPDGFWNPLFQLFERFFELKLAPTALTGSFAQTDNLEHLPAMLLGRTGCPDPAPAIMDVV